MKLQLSFVLLFAFSGGAFAIDAPPQPLKLPYADQILAVSERYGVDPQTMFAIIEVESSYKWYATSNKHKPEIGRARGLSQLMPRTAWYECSDIFVTKTYAELYDVEKNLECGARYYSEQMKRFKNERLALMSYNQGYGRTLRGDIGPEATHYYRKISKVKKANRHLFKYTKKKIHD